MRLPKRQCPNWQSPGELHTGDPRGPGAAALRRACLESTRALVAAVEARDAFTERHSARVSAYAGQIARRLGLSPAQVDSVRTAARLHDIGKIGIPDAILRKPGPLAAAEFAIIRRHPAIALEILGHASFFERELPLILHHHEHFDGSGYPAGLAGQRIPLGARILNVADALDAMLATRSYKAPMSIARAKMELVRCQGRQFDPHVVRATLHWLADAARGKAPGPPSAPPPTTEASRENA